MRVLRMTIFGRVEKTKQMLVTLLQMTERMELPSRCIFILFLRMEDKSDLPQELVLFCMTTLGLFFPLTFDVLLQRN